jgi:hypothetical protein
MWTAKQRKTAGAPALVVISLGWGGGARGAADDPFRHGALRVSENHRFLEHRDGTPFFYLGDTAWELFHRLTLADTARYLDDRAAKGYTVIQAVALAEFDGLTEPNAEGARPLVDNDPMRPHEAYFRHVDAVVKMARERGLYIGLLPTWGDKVGKAWGIGPVGFQSSNARFYGRWLGRRYADAPNLIWILGGDRDAKGVEPVWRAMAEGIREGDHGAHLISFHPTGGQSSATLSHNEAWLDFNMVQSGHHQRDIANYAMIERDYARSPAKPVLDGEPRYEDQPINWKPDNGWFDDYDARQGAYWAIFAGAAGHTYGCHDIWQFRTPRRAPVSQARSNWTAALDLPGARQVGFVRRLMLARPYFSRVPDQTLIVAGQAPGAGHLQATRGDGYAMIYFPLGAPATIALDKLGDRQVQAWWFDPRQGTAQAAGLYEARAPREFTPPGRPGRGNDWVLVLDDAARQYAAPGL